MILLPNYAMILFYIMVISLNREEQLRTYEQPGRDKKPKNLPFMSQFVLWTFSDSEQAQADKNEKVTLRNWT